VWYTEEMTLGLIVQMVFVKRGKDPTWRLGSQRRMPGKQKAGMAMAS
jgi:hypothetical protein